MTLHRRAFLRGGVTAGSLIALGPCLPGFIQRTANAAAMADQPGAKDTILVVIELTGGNDGLNTVVPFKDPAYAGLRPTLKQPTDQLRKINDELGLHPQLSGLSDILDKDQALCVVQGVGYPNPDESHFRSMDIWQAASLESKLTEGWLGKTLKRLPNTPSFHLKNNNEASPLAYEGAPVRVPSINTLEEFQLQLAAASGADKTAQREVIEGGTKTSPGTGGPSLLDFVQRTAANTYASSRRLQEVAKNYQPKVPYPDGNPLATRLRLAAQLIEAGIGSRIFYVSLANFDTHAAQAPAHAQLLGQLSAAVSAFWRDLAARGHKDRLLIMTFSEFGRRAKENGSRGTDHGSAAPMFLIGGKVKPGAVGAHPSLTELAMGNLRHHTDFRQVYAAILDSWLGVSSKDVLGGTYTPVDVFKA
jgi:uncharacterized protein (DUF1501 family)